MTLKRKTLVWLIIGLILVSSVLAMAAVPLVRRGLEWCEMRRHFQNCQALQLVTMQFYQDHHADNPPPIASFVTLREGNYIDAGFIKDLNRDEGVYCFFTPLSSEPTDPVVGYFSRKDTVIFAVNGAGSISRDDVPPPPASK